MQPSDFGTRVEYIHGYIEEVRLATKVRMTFPNTYGTHLTLCRQRTIGASVYPRVVDYSEWNDSDPNPGLTCHVARCYVMLV